MQSRSLLVGIVVLSLPLMMGCGGGEEKEAPPTVPVSGVVTYNGAPVEGATVGFQPIGMDQKPATGTTGADGRFELTTYISGIDYAPGAMPGDYQVTISKTESSVSGESVEDQMRQQMTGGAPAGPKHLLPEKYASPETTDLTANVGADGAEGLEFTLTD